MIPGINLGTDLPHDDVFRLLSRRWFGTVCQQVPVRSLEPNPVYYFSAWIDFNCQRFRFRQQRNLSRAVKARLEEKE